MARAAQPKPTTGRKRIARKAPPEPRGIAPQECRLESVSGAVAEVTRRIEAEGGAVLAAYRDPLGSNPLLLAALPIDRIEPTPFQRDLSQPHSKRLASVIERTGLYLDPVIAVMAPDRGFWTPNGRHRLEAMRRLGAKAITALVVPQREIAWQILALNTEKAHNLRERSHEVIRIYQGLVEEAGARPESEFAFYLEDAALVTLGLCYEQRGTFAGGAYAPILRRLEEFSDQPLRVAIEMHERHAQLLLKLDDKVAELVAQLKARGLMSPYLRSFVVARINPLRWIEGEAPPLEQVLQSMQERAGRFKVDKVRQEDLVGVAGAPDEEA
jgi:ParB family chromosome partitioning protein